MSTVRRFSRRILGAAAAGASLVLLGAAVSASGYGSGSGELKGDYEKGQLEIQLNRGAAVPLELTVIETPNSCNGHIDLTMKWDEEENWVKVKLKGKKVLEPYPDVDRTPGVDFMPNEFFPEQEDIVDGRYQLWIVTTGRSLDFYYDPMTLDLMGSELDFETPPSPIVVPFPTLRLFPSPFFQPKSNGDLNYEWTFDYDVVKRGDVPELSEFYLTFPPPNLCEVNPFRIDLSHLRPYASPPQPLELAPSFDEYLRGGLIFDITVEPSEFYTDPPLQTNIGSYSQSTMQGGEMPRNWTLNIDSVLGNVAPPIDPWPGAASCGQWTPPFHDMGINFCE